MGIEMEDQSMESCAQCGASGTALKKTRVSSHDDIVLANKVVLLNAVERVQCGECDHSVDVVPNQESLVAAVALLRVHLPHKLSGKEIRLLRLAMKVKAIDLAKKLGVTAEALSRWENGDAIGNAAEKCLRLTVALDMEAKAPAIDIDLAAIMSMEISPVWPTEAPPVFCLETVLVKHENQKNRSWDAAA